MRTSPSRTVTVYGSGRDGRRQFEGVEGFEGVGTYFSESEVAEDCWFPRRNKSDRPLRRDCLPQEGQTTMNKVPSRRRISHNRRGTLAVEMALTMPLLFLVILTSIEFSRMNVIRHTASSAAYEAARRAIVPGATAAQADGIARRIMATSGATGVIVDVTPAVINIDTEEVTVEVTVPIASNGFVVPKFFSGQSFVGISTLRREDL